MKKLSSVQEFFSNGNDVIRTFTGRFVDPFNMSTDDVDLEDIAHGLANIRRFGGQTRKPISVLSHIYFGYQYLLWEGDAPRTDEEMLHWLLHDAAEAYIGDIPSPIKNRLYDFQSLESGLKSVIYQKFEVKSGVPYFVSVVDEFMLKQEVTYMVIDRFPKLKKSELRRWFMETVLKHYYSMVPGTSNKSI